MLNEWKKSIIHKMHTDKYVFSIYEPVTEGDTKYSLYIEEDTYEVWPVADYEFDTLEAAKEFAEKWVPPCSVCFSDPCTCTGSVLTANFEDEDLSPIQDLFAGKDYYCEVVFSGKSTKVWSGKLATYLLLRLKLYGEWSMEYSFEGERAVGKVNTFEGSFDFSVERF